MRVIDPPPRLSVTVNTRPLHSEKRDKYLVSKDTRVQIVPTRMFGRCTHAVFTRFSSLKKEEHKKRRRMKESELDGSEPRMAAASRWVRLWRSVLAPLMKRSLCYIASLARGQQVQNMSGNCCNRSSVFKL